MKNEHKVALCGLLFILLGIIVIIFGMWIYEEGDDFKPFDDKILGWENGINHEYNLTDMSQPVFLVKPPPRPLDDWESLDQLKKWLSLDDTSEHRYFKAGLAFNKQCVRQAEQLRDNASADGKHIEITVLSPREHLRIFGTAKKAYHAVGMANVDGFYYVIEPTTDMVKKAYTIP